MGAECGAEDREYQVEDGDDAAEEELDLEPRYLEELLDQVEQVEHKEDPGEPDAGHWDGREPAGAARIVAACFNADETQQAQDL